MSSKDDFLTAATAFAPRPVVVGDLRCCVRKLSLHDMAAIRKAGRDNDEARIAILTIRGSLCDDAGKPLFTAADDKAMEQWPAEFINQIMDVIHPADDEQEPDAQGN